MLAFEAERDVRSYPLQRFRYRVVTAFAGDQLLVIAVAHTSRAPGYWRERLK